jgi:hypothetical protein
VEKTYPYQKMMTPYDKLKSLPKVENYLQPDVTLKTLSDIANQMSDNKFAKMMVKARSNLFEYITRRINGMPGGTFVPGSLLD